MAFLQAIFVSAQAGDSMSIVQRVKVIAGVGLEGDRYSTGRGTFSKREPLKNRQVSLIENERVSETEFWGLETRRNLLTNGIDLNSLVGREFYIGKVKMRGTELCKPCNWPSERVGKPGFKAAFEGCGGLRAEILNDGVISVGDEIVCV